MLIFFLGVGFLCFALIFAMDRSDNVTLSIFDLRQSYPSLFTFPDLVAESTFHALEAESNYSAFDLGRVSRHGRFGRLLIKANDNGTLLRNNIFNRYVDIFSNKANP